MDHINVAEHELTKGCIPDTPDPRDVLYHHTLIGAPVPFDWNAGFDVEKKLNIKIKIKNQDRSMSCVGQGNSYLAATVNAAIL